MFYRLRESIGDGCSWGCSVLPSLIFGLIWIYVIGTGVYSCITGTAQQADIVTIKITNTGFEPRSVTLSTNQRLHVVNASSHAVVICIGHKQVCSGNASANKATPTATAMPMTKTTSMAKITPTTVATPMAAATATPTVVAMLTGGLTIPPGKSYDLSFKNGNYGFTIMPQVGVVFANTDLGVTVRESDNSAADSGSDNSSMGDSGGGSVGVGVSSGSSNNGVSVSSGSDDEEDSSSSSGTSSGGASSGGSDDGGGGSSGGSSGGSGGGDE
jgi:hypothetical protein